MEEGITTLKKLPPWAWGVAVAGGLALWWFSTHHSSSSSSSSGSGSSVLPPEQGSINTNTPNCPSYPPPACLPGQTITNSFDQQGCPMPICSANGGAGSTQTDQYVTTNGHQSFYNLSQVHVCWGEDRIKFWVAFYGGHPELSGVSDSQILPAGIKAKVCGTFP